MTEKVPVFDIGDTISSSIPVARKAVYEYLLEKDIKNIPEFPVREVDQYSPGSVRKWLENEGLDADAEKVTARIKERKIEALERAGAFETLEKIGDKINTPGIVSDNSTAAKKFHEKLFRDRNVEFDSFVVSEEVGVKKPDEKIFREFLERRGADGSSCVYYGNDTRRDPAAEKVGMGFVWVNAFRTWGDPWDGVKIDDFNYRAVKKSLKEVDI